MGCASTATCTPCSKIAAFDTVAANSARQLGYCGKLLASNPVLTRPDFISQPRREFEVRPSHVIQAKKMSQREEMVFPRVRKTKQAVRVVSLKCSYGRETGGKAPSMAMDKS